MHTDITEYILIVDDEPAITDVLQIRCRAAGYGVVTAHSGEALFRRLQETTPSIILLDIMMPGLNGYEVKKRLNESLETASIPVIFLTGKDATQDKISGLRLGIDDYITKPFNGDEVVARIAAILERRKFYEKISMTDGLTGLYNTFFFKKQFTYFFESARRYKKTFSLCIIDLNDFKIINDTYGHVVGDFVLKRLADILIETLRKTDVVTRYGGDEFIIIFPEENASAANIAMGHVLEKINAETYHQFDEKTQLSFTISYGISTFNESLASEVDMLAAADAALYENKKAMKKEK